MHDSVGSDNFTVRGYLPLIGNNFVTHMSLSKVLGAISFNIDEVLLIIPSNAFVFGDFNIHHSKDWLTCSGGTDRPGKLCYKISI